MSLTLAGQNVRAVIDRFGRQQVMDLLRAAVFIGALLLSWISLRPFGDLSSQLLQDTGTGNEGPTYLAFGCLAVLTFGLVIGDNLRGLKTLFAPAFVLFAAWIAISVVLSLDPGTSIRRFSLNAFVIVVTATILLLPRSQRELLRWLSIGALILLAVCYLGVLLAPHLSIHAVTDAQEPQLAGDWRGVFGHKNQAAGIMAMLLFLGIASVRSGARISGVAVILLASAFLVNTSGKSASALLLAVLVLSSLVAVLHSFWLRAVVLLTPLLVLNMLSVGTVMSTSLASLAQTLPLDSSFTGRADVWAFALQSLQQRLSTGYGFAAFWGTEAVRNLPEGKEWTEYASHSHNGYLDAALTMGLPGLALLILALVIAPLRNFQAAERSGNDGPLTMAMLQIWLFGIYLSSLESFFLDRADPTWFTFLLAVFGLHYLARFRARA